jgi:hypothetical protein
VGSGSTLKSSRSRLRGSAAAGSAGAGMVGGWPAGDLGAGVPFSEGVGDGGMPAVSLPVCHGQDGGADGTRNAQRTVGKRSRRNGSLFLIFIIL